MTSINRKTAVQEINQLEEREKLAGLDAIARFSRRMARYFELFSPSAEPLFASPTTPDGEDAAAAANSFRSWLKENKLF